PAPIARRTKTILSTSFIIIRTILAEPAWHNGTGYNLWRSLVHTEGRPILTQSRISTYNCAAHNYVLLMKTNITLKLDADLLREVRVLAAEEDTSISALLAARLEQIVRERKSFQRARKRALARLRDGMDLHWTRPRSRDELHER